MSSASPSPAAHRPSLYELDLRCPPLPKTLLEAVELAHEEDGPDFDRVCKLVQHDPSVTARVLRIANSAYYGQRGRIESAQRGVLVLGPSSVLGIIMSMSLLELRATLDASTMPIYLNLVRHSIAVAFLAEHILKVDPAENVVRHATPAQLGEAYTAGVLHDFGKLVLLYNYGEDAVSFYETRQPDRTLIEAERERFGHDHVETGLYFAQQLNLPETLSDAIAGHHAEGGFDGSDSVKRLVNTIAVANCSANGMGYATTETRSFDERRGDSCWQALVAAPGIHYGSTDRLQETVLAASDELEAYVEAIV